MADKVSQDLKDLREKVYELEDEMSVSTRNNIYCEDIKKSRRLLIYRYALLLQIKDLRQIRRKVETRIAKINTLKTQSARGRMLTKREMDAIYNLKIDIRKQEEIVEEYDNKKEIYSDKRIAYYGIDNELIKIFYKYSNDFEPHFTVSEKNVSILKEQLDESHNIKENMNDMEILNANEDRYGDEIVDFDLGIIFDNEVAPSKKQKVEIIEQEVIQDKKIKTKTKESELSKLEDSINEIKNIVINEEEKENNNNINVDDEDSKDEIDIEEEIIFGNKSNENKYNYNNGYNLYTEEMNSKIELDSIELEIESDIAEENKKITEETQKLLSEKYEINRDNYITKNSEDSLTQLDENVKQNYEKQKVVLSDEKMFKKTLVKKTVKNIKEKLELKEKLENYINQKGNDLAREYYNNEIRNANLDTDDDIEKIDNALNYDIYELGILYIIDRNIKKMKRDGDDDEDIKKLINQLYQIKMQYKLFPGICFNDIKEFDPEVVISEVRMFDDNETMIDISEVYRVVNNFTLSSAELKKRYRHLFGMDKNNEQNNIFQTEISLLDKNEDDEMSLS